jgi:hypothetical protein
MTRMLFTGWCAPSVASSLDQARAKPFSKVSVLTGVCEFLMSTMLPFSSDAKLWLNGS